MTLEFYKLHSSNTTENWKSLHLGFFKSVLWFEVFLMNIVTGIQKKNRLLEICLLGITGGLTKEVVFSNKRFHTKTWKILTRKFSRLYKVNSSLVKV